MKRIHKITGAISFIVTVLLLFVNMAPACFAAGGRATITYISTFEQLMAWYHSDNTKNMGASLTADIVIDRAVEWTPTVGQREISTDQHTFRIAAGGSLKMDNPNMRLFCIITGNKGIFKVERDGSLILNRGGASRTVYEDVVIVERGGSFVKAEGFLLNGNVQNENDTMLPPPQATPIISAFAENFHLTVLAGEVVSRDKYPKDGWAGTSTSTVILPVEWDTSTVDFNKVGRYTITGHFTEEGLAANNLSNPYGLTVSMTVTVCKQGGIVDLQGQILSVDFNGLTMSQMVFPALPEDITSLYLYKSMDGVHWEKAYKQKKNNNGTLIDYDDLAEDITTIGANSFLPFKYNTNRRPLWIKAQVVGSIYEGTTNSILLTGSNNNNSNIEDGSFDGNRGGGTQGEEERELPSQELAAVAQEEMPSPELPAIAEKPLNQPPPTDTSSITGGSTSEGYDNTSSEQDTSSKPEESSNETSSEEEDTKVESAQETLTDTADRDEKPSVSNVTIALFGGAGVITLAGYIFIKRKFH